MGKKYLTIFNPTVIYSFEKVRNTCTGLTDQQVTFFWVTFSLLQTILTYQLYWNHTWSTSEPYIAYILNRVSSSSLLWTIYVLTNNYIKCFALWLLLKAPFNTKTQNPNCRRHICLDKLILKSHWSFHRHNERRERSELVSFITGRHLTNTKSM